MNYVYEYFLKKETETIKKEKEYKRNPTQVLPQVLVVRLFLLFFFLFVRERHFLSFKSYIAVVVIIELSTQK